MTSSSVLYDKQQHPAEYCDRGVARSTPNAAHCLPAYRCYRVFWLCWLALAGRQPDLPQAVAPLPGAVRGRHRQRLGGHAGRGHAADPIPRGYRCERDREGRHATGVIRGAFEVAFSFLVGLYG